MSDSVSETALRSGATARTEAIDDSRPMRRVLIIVENLPLPFDRRVWQEARTLSAAGYRVSIICRRKQPAYMGPPNSQDVKVVAGDQLRIGALRQSGRVDVDCGGECAQHSLESRIVPDELIEGIAESAAVRVGIEPHQLFRMTDGNAADNCGIHQREE